MSQNYAASGAAGAASTTSATAGLLAVYNPTAAPGGGSRIYEWSVGPGANSADENYSVRLRRATTVSTWGTAVTPTDLGPRASTALSLSGVNSSARGTLSAGNIGTWGFHMRGGYRWVSVPGGEICNDYTVNHGVELEYFFAQGTSIMEGCFFFSE